MNDLNSLDWNAQASPSQQPRLASNNQLPSTGPGIQSVAGSHAMLLQPQSRPGSAFTRGRLSTSPLKAASPANDSFSNLLPTASSKAKTNPTLQDRQRQLQEERQRQIQEQQQRHVQEAQLWDRLGGTRPSQGQTPGALRNPSSNEDVDDILAAFNSSAQVDRSSHFPPPTPSNDSDRSTTGISQANGYNRQQSSSTFENVEDDDPFGLGTMMKPKVVAPAPSSVHVDDDILGDLSRPVQPRTSGRPPSAVSRTPPPELPERVTKGTPFDRQIAELVDMGFPVDQAESALTETNGNLQTAVSWLLNRAHSEAQQKAKGKTDRTHSPMKQPAPDSNGRAPAWMRADSRSGSQQRHEDSAASGEKDVSQYATEVGSAFFKSANSLWKAGRKQVQKAVSDFQQDGDTSQPKWMRDASTDSRMSESSSQPAPTNSDAARKVAVPDVTDEALLLESGSGRPQRIAKATSKLTHELPASSPLRGRSPAQVLPERVVSQQRATPPPAASTRPPTKLSREHIEEQAAQAYVSSARRRKPATPVSPPIPQAAAVDLFSPDPTSSTPMNSTQSHVGPVKASKPATPRPVAISRSIPSISPSILNTSATNRLKGTEAFKRGDYDGAHQAYTSALTGVPPTHPIRIVILSNRSLTALKTGDPKLAIADADAALALIGPGKGENELINVGAEGEKPMRDFYGKALTRKAEALESLEKWADAAAIWREAVEANVGGLVAVRGRDRCIRAAEPSTAKPATKSAPRPARAPARPAARAAAAGPGASQEAVKKLRAQNAAAEKLDDERFALGDAVSARIETWKGGKSDNLRALLGSLETVLWDGAGWKKVGMAELIQVNRVKIVYMKAIAKVHPDKIAQDATTEQRMISGSVFSTLNEAWDKFKTDNGL
ncbi:UBA domain-containing protein 7 [Sphaceloma murrayae]|uniref:UBA domain-containing protein 7 n=1 Tax=Sphaceloma murrayae TaxID=2082308 RepID=A0A2K1R1P4_9PEZI|nr:UBA domain-containing protein 7 [Sphaceloma murrayae]